MLRGGYSIHIFSMCTSGWSYLQEEQQNRVGYQDFVCAFTLAGEHKDKPIPRIQP